MQIKVVCLNIWLGGKLFPEMLDFLRQTDADVLLLQEVFASDDASLEPRFRSVQALQQELKYAHYDFDRNFSQLFDFGTVERGNAIFSKLPILERNSYLIKGEDGIYEDIPANFGKWRHTLQHVVIEAADKPCNIFNFQGMWDLDGDRDSPERLHMSQVIIDAVRGKKNVILAGDTNAKPNTQTIGNIEAELINIFKNELKTTFNLRHKDLEKYPGYATAVVDMAFVSPSINVIATDCPDIDVSDHLPLIFTVEIS